MAGHRKIRLVSASGVTEWELHTPEIAPREPGMGVGYLKILARNCRGLKTTNYGSAEGPKLPLESPEKASEALIIAPSAWLRPSKITRR